MLEPDEAMFLDDLSLIGELMDGSADRATMAYAMDFARGLARSVGDTELLAAVARLEAALDHGRPILPEIGNLAALVQTRTGGRRMAG